MVAEINALKRQLPADPAEDSAANLPALVRLANLHQGAVAARLEPTPRQLDACRVVAEELNPLGLYLLGLDFIGDDLTEVNFTSPTTIVQVNRVNGIRADIELVDELERMWRAR